MVFNVDKCKAMSICRNSKKFEYKYTLYGKTIESVEIFKDLGVNVSSSLNWHNHIDSIVAKANRINGLIKRTVGYSAPHNVTLNLYKSLSRSNLEYCSPVWSPQTSGDVFRIEQIQRSMTRYILHNPSNLHYKERCEKLNIIPLSYRREISDLVLFYKGLHHLNEFNIDDFVDVQEHNSRRNSNVSSGMLLRMPIVRTDKFKSSYYNRIVMEWNILPVDVKSSPSLNIFKKRVTEYYRNQRLDNFNPDNMCTYRSTCKCLSCGCVRLRGFN